MHVVSTSLTIRLMRHFCIPFVANGVQKEARSYRRITHCSDPYWMKGAQSGPGNS
jgi:hypothetical protein